MPWNDGGTELSSETALFEDRPGQLTDLSSETVLFEDRRARGEGRGRWIMSWDGFKFPGKTLSLKEILNDIESL